MPLKVTFPGTFTVFNPADAGAFLSALATCQVVQTTGWGDEAKQALIKEKPSIEIIDDLDFAPPPAPIQELQDRLRASEKSWLDYYTKFTNSEKRVKELEEKIASITNTVNETKAP